VAADEMQALLQEAAPGLSITSPFLLTTLPGFGPTLGHLAGIMTYARVTTLRDVRGLSTEQLDHRLDDQSNSIGMLLEHMACIEEAYQEMTLGLAFEEAALERRKIGTDLGPAAWEAIRGHDLAHYRGRLADVRRRTLAELARRDDDWLFEEVPFVLGQRANNYFMWFHVAEDELNHRGQIRLLRKRLPG